VVKVSPVRADDSRVARLALLTTVLAVLLTAGAAAATGPGGDASYRGAAAKICTKASNDVATAIDDAVKRYGRTKKAIAVSLVATLSIGRRRYSALHALQPPAELRPLHLQVLSLFSRGLDVLAGVVQDVKAGADPQLELPKLDPSVALGKKESVVWRKLGVAACA
jgi:hypothetical protein